MREQEYIDMCDVIEEQLLRYDAKLQIKLTEKFEKMREQILSQIDTKIQEVITKHCVLQHSNPNIREWLGK